jgi:hypothetical protein
MTRTDLEFANDFVHECHAHIGVGGLPVFACVRKIDELDKPKVSGR